jgi:conjugation system TraG family ATPase
MIDIEKILPVYQVQNDCMVSGQGDLTIAFRVAHMDIFSASAADYDALHHSWLKALRILPAHTIVHKQDYFIRSAHQGNPVAEVSFLTRKAEQAFEGREYLKHRCYLMLTRKAPGRRDASSGYSTLMRKTIVPSQVLDERLLMDFQEKAGAFVQILSDRGLVGLTRIHDDELTGTSGAAGIIEQYCFLQQPDELPLIRDVHLKDGICIGDDRLQVFGLSELDQLPSLCGSCITYDKYSTDKTRFSTGFASHLGMLLNCNHLYNQYLFIGDSQQALKALERKRLRLQSLSAYSRENAIAAGATADFLNEAITSQRMPVKAHFNLMVWTNDPAKMQELRNQAGAAMAAMDAVAKQETDGAPQIWWAGIPGNAADFPMNDAFDTFLEQASCFLNMESNCSSSALGIRFGDRSFGRPVNVDLFDEPMKTGLITNRNLFICGGSGGGKSMAMNHMLRTLYDQGTHCVHS